MKSLLIWIITGITVGICAPPIFHDRALAPEWWKPLILLLWYSLTPFAFMWAKGIKW